MITRRILPPLHILSLVVVALALLVATPGSAAASSEHVGAGVVVAIPGPVALLAYLTAGAVVLGLMVARRRPTV